jgi:outer membrane murein-binding lipoprotein Lpp
MTLRSRDRMALVVLAVLALMGGFYLLVLKPERQKVNDLDSQIATQRAALAQAEQSYQTGRTAQSALKADAAEWASLHLAVPNQSDIPALLRTLQKTAAQVHVKMAAITLASGSGSAAAPAAPASTAPSSTAPSSTAPSSTASSAGSSPSSPSSTSGNSSSKSGATPGGKSAASTAPAAIPVPVQLSFSGGYTALNRLVRRLQGLVMVSGGKVRARGPLVSISSISLTGAPNLTVQLTASLYQLSAPPSVAGSTTGGQG